MMLRTLLAVLITVASALANPPKPTLTKVRDNPLCMLFLADPSEEAKLLPKEEYEYARLVEYLKKSQDTVKARIFIVRGRPGHTFAASLKLRGGKIRLHESLVSEDQVFYPKAKVIVFREGEKNMKINTEGEPFAVPKGEHRIEMMINVCNLDPPTYSPRSHYILIEELANTNEANKSR